MSKKCSKYYFCDILWLDRPTRTHLKVRPHNEWSTSCHFVFSMSYQWLNIIWKIYQNHWYRKRFHFCNHFHSFMRSTNALSALEGGVQRHVRPLFLALRVPFDPTNFSRNTRGYGECSQTAWAFRKTLILIENYEISTNILYHPGSSSFIGSKV